MQAATNHARKSAADLNLERRVLLTLAQLHVPLLRHLRAEANEGTITLSGRVTTYYERQLAQSRARRVPGVIRLIDTVNVVERPKGPSGMASLLVQPRTRAADELARAALIAEDRTELTPLRRIA